MNHRGTETQRETQRTSQTRRHKDTKVAHPHAQIAHRSPRYTQMTSLMRQCRELTAETSAIWRSPPTGGKPVNSGRKRPSLPCFPPADAPGARRFRLFFLFFWRGGAIHRTTGEEGSGEACALRERRPLGRATATNACVRSGDPVQRSPAVVRRWLGPRHVLGSRERPSALSA